MEILGRVEIAPTEQQQPNGPVLLADDGNENGGELSSNVKVNPEPPPGTPSIEAAGKTPAQPPVKQVKRPPAAQPKPAVPADKKDNGRKTLSMVVNAEEYDHLQEIINARVDKGFSKNANQFFRQCIDMAINWDDGNYNFAVPAQLRKKLFLEIHPKNKQ